MDTILIAIAVIVFPVWSVIEHRRLPAKIAAGDTDVRLKLYRTTMISEWFLALAVLVTWLYSARSISALGLDFDTGTGFWIGAALTLVASVLILAQTRQVVRSEKQLTKVRDEFGSLADMVPRDDREARWWSGLSLTAGICEEIVYRGFLIAVLATAFDLWLAVILAAVAFGVAHAYQGPKGILKTGVVGLIAGGLFVLTGSLWLPMLLHALVDVTSGHMGRRALEHSVVNTAPASA
jgi:membrane protease YdiL (CAAX protease family)